MNKKYLFSILTMVMLIMTPLAYADVVIAPSYQVDVTQSVAAVDVNGPVVMTKVKSTQSKNTNLNMTSLNTSSKPHSLPLIMACGYESVENVNLFSVSGGDSIGIGRPI